MRKSEVDRLARRPAARGLSRSAAAVYRVLLVCARTDSNGALPWELGDERLRRETGYSRTTVKAARRELVEVGLLEVRQVGLGRARSLYTVVLHAVGVEITMAEARATEMAQAAGIGRPGGVAETPSVSDQTDPQRVDQRPPEGRKSTHPTRAHPSLSGSSSPYPSGQGPSTGDEAPLRGTEEPSPGSAGAASCPVAVRRGTPCVSCRACGTNPRALRRRAAVAKATQGRVFDLIPYVEPEEKRRRTAEGLALVAATMAARAAPSGSDQGPPPDPAALSGAGGGP